MINVLITILDLSEFPTKMTCSHTSHTVRNRMINVCINILINIISRVPFNPKFVHFSSKLQHC